MHAMSNRIVFMIKHIPIMETLKGLLFQTDGLNLTTYISKHQAMQKANQQQNDFGEVSK